MILILWSLTMDCWRDFHVMMRPDAIRKLKIFPLTRLFMVRSQKWHFAAEL